MQIARGSALYFTGFNVVGKQYIVSLFLFSDLNINELYQIIAIQCLVNVEILKFNLFS
jgi:hypothetical protein